jgi:[acyl-carrier-protein] S-malonyltransferase
MAAVVGGDPEDVLAAISAAGLEPANVNGGGQTVAAGAQERIEAFAANPPERARVIPLKVAGAFHTSYMAPASDAVASVAQTLQTADPAVTILTNSDGTAIASGADYLQLLVSQVTSPVRWDLCQQTLVESGVTGILELVPGGTLTGLAKRAMKGVEVFPVKSAADVDGAREFVRAHSGA